MTEREKIAARIRALLAKTVANGCTEDEAIAAAGKAAELLERYNMTLDEAELRASPFTRRRERYDDAVGARLWKVAQAIADLVGCRYWSSATGVFPVSVDFFGFEHEVEIATYLLEICRRSMLDGEKRMNARYALLVPSRRRGKVLPFLDGMADALARRIRALNPPKPPGRGLVVVRNDLIDRALQDEGIKLKDVRMRPSRNGETYFDGVKAGQAVSLNPGLRGAAPAHRIGTSHG